MSEMIWKCISYAMVGTSHQMTGKGCEDVVLTSISEGFSFLVLADGAGFASMAQDGARIASKACLRWLIKHKGELFSKNERDLKYLLIRTILSALYRAALKKNVPVQELSSTLLFVATNGVHYICGHIGDGVIGTCVEDECLAISLPEKGEFANNTFFTTSFERRKHLRMKRGTVGKIDGFFLMSDGSADCLFRAQTSDFAPAVLKFSQILRNTPSKDVTAIDSKLKDLMENHFKTLTNDDCSFIMLIWSKE